MNDRCRVFALNGEELFPCRWAKAKKLVKANVAEKIMVDGKMCIKMLEPTRMNKPKEAIMNNEKNETQCIAVGNGEYTVHDKLERIDLNAKEVYVNGKRIDEYKAEFPEILYRLDYEKEAVVVFNLPKGTALKSDGIYLSNFGEDEEYYIKVDKKFICDKEINENYIEKSGGWPYRTKLYLAVQDFEMFKQENIKRLEKELERFKSKTIPQILK